MLHRVGQHFRIDGRRRRFHKPDPELTGALSAEDQAEVILAIISVALKTMSISRISEVRIEIATELNASVPLVRMAREVIDGQLALRAIAGDELWR